MQFMQLPALAFWRSATPSPRAIAVLVRFLIQQTVLAGQLAAAVVQRMRAAPAGSGPEAAAAAPLPELLAWLRGLPRACVQRALQLSERLQRTEPSGVTGPLLLLTVRAGSSLGAPRCTQRMGSAPCCVIGHRGAPPEHAPAIWLLQVTWNLPLLYGVSGFVMLSSNPFLDSISFSDGSTPASPLSRLDTLLAYLGECVRAARHAGPARACSLPCWPCGLPHPVVGSPARRRCAAHALLCAVPHSVLQACCCASEPRVF